jgi:hypothetical protein
LVEDTPEDFHFKTASRGWENDDVWDERRDLSSSGRGPSYMKYFQSGGLGWYSPRRCRMLIEETSETKSSKDNIWLNELCVRVAPSGSIKLYLDENYAQNTGEQMSPLEHDIHTALCEMLQESSMRKEANMRKETLRRGRRMLIKWWRSHHKTKTPSGPLRPGV